MSHEAEKHYEKDIRYNWVSSSRFLFYLSVFGVLGCVVAGSYELYRNHYPGKPVVEVQGSSKYVPVYK